jgi:hypothetical protein
MLGFSQDFMAAGRLRGGEHDHSKVVACWMLYGCEWVADMWRPVRKNEPEREIHFFPTPAIAWWDEGLERSGASIRRDGGEDSGGLARSTFHFYWLF